MPIRRHARRPACCRLRALTGKERDTLARRAAYQGAGSRATLGDEALRQCCAHVTNTDYAALLLST